MVRNLLVNLRMIFLMLINAFDNYFVSRKSIFDGHFLAGKNEFFDFYFAFSQGILVIKQTVFFPDPNGALKMCHLQHTDLKVKTVKNEER